MGIISLVTDTTGQVNVNPRRVKMITTDATAAVTTAGYLNKSSVTVFPIYKTDVFDVQTSYNVATGVGVYVELFPSIVNGVITLQQTAPSGVITPTIANHIATYTNTSGTLSEDPATAISGGHIQAGLSGTAGRFDSFPGTALRGRFRFEAQNNAADHIVTLRNGSHNQATTYTLNDVGIVTAEILQSTIGGLGSGNLLYGANANGYVADSGIPIGDVARISNIKAAQTGNIGGSGAGPINVGIGGLNSGSIIVANVASSDNQVSVVACINDGGSGGFNITFSGDPGSNCFVNYVAFVNPQ